jgi:hypothetical protein
VDCKIVWVYSKKSGDLSQFPPQVKLVRFGTVEFYEAMAQSKGDALPGEIPVVVHRKSREKWLVTLDFERWLDMIEG